MRRPTGRCVIIVKVYEQYVMRDDSFTRYSASKSMALSSGIICLALGISILTSSKGAVAQSLVERTFLLDIRQGSSRSESARKLSFGGYELDDGTPVTFERWYTPNIPEFNILFLTAVTPSFGVTWGLSTGERAEKYRIKPGLWLGFVYRHQITARSSISLSATTLFGGNYREHPCEAFYSIIVPSRMITFPLRDLPFSWQDRC